MSTALLLLTPEVSDDAIVLVENLNRHGYYAIPRIGFGRGADDYVRRALAEFGSFGALLLLVARDDAQYMETFAAQVAQIRQAVPGVRVINVLLPNASRPVVDGPVVEAPTFSPAVIGRIIAAIESGPRPQIRSADIQKPSLAIVWDPTLVTALEYAELVVAIGDLARAQGGTGIQRVEGGLLLLETTAGARVR